jgi:hypothetical protein
MKKNETIIRQSKLEEVRFRFKQLRRDLFPDRYVTAIINYKSDRHPDYQQVVYMNQHIGREYSFPHISFSERKSC